MHMKQYPEEKRRILAQRSVDDFVGFIEEIKGQAARSLQQKTPRPKGYRSKGKLKPEVQLSILKRFVSRCTEEKEISNPHSDLWTRFADIFVLWVKSHDRLFEILEDFKNEEDFNQEKKHIVAPNSELDYQCFSALLAASRNSLIDLETIRRFYEYGYFLPSNEIETLIEKALPKAEIEGQQRLAALPNQVRQLSEAIDLLKSQLSAAVQTPDRQIAEAIKSFETQLSETKSSFNDRAGQLKQSVNTRFSSVEESVKSLEVKLTNVESVNSMKQEIVQLDQRIQASVQSIGAQLDGLDRKIAQIKTEREAQHQTTDAPRIANQAVRIGKRFSSQLTEDTEHYADENAYLSYFEYYLRKFGITNPDETADEWAVAIHIALKAYSTLEVADARIIDVWRLMCGDHLYITKINVEMAWLGLQDWFPLLFSEECFEEELRRIDLDLSIRNMLEIGDMPWAIHFDNCDRSFPECYLPQFLDWIDGFSDGAIRIFLTRCSGRNRCETNEDVYEWVARLPKPQGPEPIMARKIKPSNVIVTQSDWESWCRPNSDAIQLPLLNQLQEVIENEGMQIPTVLLREILQYCRLSHGVLAPSRSLDWALTLRLLPWISYRHELIETVQNLMNQESSELSHFRDGLLQAREGGE